MKICQICTVDFTLYHFLLPLMRAMREAGHEIVGACAPGALAARVRDEGFRVESLPLERSLSPQAHLRGLIATTRFFRREKFDLVHAHTPIGALIARAAAAMSRVPLVAYTAHGFYFHERMRRLPYAALASMEWIAGRFTDVLFTQAEEDAATARRLRLCRGGRIIAIGNGSDPQRFRPAAAADERMALRKSLATDADRIVIICVARLVAEKGIPELFEAMRGVDAELWLVGDRLASDHAGGVDDALARVAADPILSCRIKLLGYRSDVPELLRAADVFVLPSHREGMPRSIIEAMLTGLPVVGTDIRGSREEIVEGVTGFLVPVGSSRDLGERFVRLAADPWLRDRMGRAGLARAREFYVEERVIARQ
jgi:glycosyltransferase involved in cell wall biosynthesis